MLLVTVLMAQRDTPKCSESSDREESLPGKRGHDPPLKLSEAGDRNLIILPFLVLKMTPKHLWPSGDLEKIREEGKGRGRAGRKEGGRKGKERGEERRKWQ